MLKLLWFKEKISPSELKTNLYPNQTPRSTAVTGFLHLGIEQMVTIVSYSLSELSK